MNVDATRSSDGGFSNSAGPGFSGTNTVADPRGVRTTANPRTNTHPASEPDRRSVAGESPYRGGQAWSESTYDFPLDPRASRTALPNLEATPPAYTIAAVPGNGNEAIAPFDGERDPSPVTVSGYCNRVHHRETGRIR